MDEKLRQDRSINYSGKLINENIIPLLKEPNYSIKQIPLDGDAPKEFILAYFFEENSTVRKASKSSWPSYIAKTAEKWYPHESVTEFMINRIGQELGLRMNEIRLVRANGRIRFLSKIFLNKNQKLVHGAEICGEHLEDMDFAKQIAEKPSAARELFTFEFIREAIKSVFVEQCDDILFDLVKMIAYDGITGNNDRHFYNWGIVDTKKKKKAIPTFSPIYDSARGLLWNISDENVKKMLRLHLQGGKKVVHYIENAAPRIGIEKNCEANHFELVNFLKKDNTEYKTIINDLATEENERRALQMLKKEFFPLFIPERCKLIDVILRERFKIIREI